MKYCYQLLIAFLLMGFSNCSVAQESLSTTNKKAIKYYNEGKTYYDKRNNELAEYNLLSAIGKDPNFIEAELLLAYVYTDQRQLKKAIIHYERCIKINPEFFPEIYSSVALLHLKFGAYEKAKKHFEKYLTFTKAPLMMEGLAQKGLVDCNFAIEALKHPVPFNPINMGENINSPLPEYLW